MELKQAQDIVHKMAYKWFDKNPGKVNKAANEAVALDMVAKAAAAPSPAVSPVAKQRKQLFVVVEGGVVQGVSSHDTINNLDIYVVDYDIDGFDADRIKTIYDAAGKPDQAGVAPVAIDVAEFYLTDPTAEAGRV